MDNYNTKSKHLLELSRLQKVRLRKYQKQMLKERTDYLESENKLELRLSQINSIGDEKDNLRELQNQFFYATSPLNMDKIKIRKYWLQYDMEMHEYYKNIEEEEKSNNHIKYISSKNKWIRENQKTEIIDNLLREAVLLNSESSEET
ncbi:MAG: hypothetical protein ABW101_02175 [Candidatus Thiodiazotropha sp.]